MNDHTSPIILIATYRLEHYYDGSLVAVCFTSAEDFWSAFYFIGSITIFFLVPLGILILLYTAIAYKLLKRHSEFQRPVSPNICNAATAGAEIVAATANVPKPPVQQKKLLRRETTTNVNSHPQNRNLSKHRQQVIFMLVTVVSSFFLCLLPFRAFTLWVIASTDETVASLGLEGYYNALYFCRIMLYLNSALNPILYNLMSSKFRSGFWLLILSCCCRRRKRKRHRGLCVRHNPTTIYSKRQAAIPDNTNSLRTRRPMKREATFVVNSSSMSSGTERTSITWRSSSLSSSMNGNSKPKRTESHSLAAAITDMSATAALTTMYFN